MKVLISIAALASMLCSCSDLNKKIGLADDNLAEEVIEDVIKEETGANIDLTPSTPEKQ